MEKRIWSNVKVFHVGRFEEIEHVATVQVDRRDMESDFDALDMAFMRTNSIDQPWFKPAPDCVVVSPEVASSGARSSSVGDVFVIDGTAYSVNRMGWKRLS